MDFIEVMQTYFRGERVEALFYILPAGLLCLGMAATAVLAHRNGFGWGLAVPLVLFGLVGMGVGMSVGMRTPKQVAQLEQAYSQDPAGMVANELSRMERVNENWPRLMATWTALVVVGLGLRFGVRSDWAQGVGPALILVGAMGFLIDGFAERRARPYTATLEKLAAETGRQSP